MISSLATDGKTAAAAVVDVQPNVTRDSSADKDKRKVTRCWIIAFVVLALAFVSAIIMVVCLAFWKQPDAPVMYTFVLHDKSTDSNVNVEAKSDPENNVEYFTSPEVNKDGKVVGQVKGIQDRETGFEAYISNDGDICLIGKSSDMDTDYETYTNGSVNERNVEGLSMYRLLNQTIDPYVLRTVAGNNIVKFCSNYTPVWMIPVDDTEDQSSTKRVKRHRKWDRYNNYNSWRCWYVCGYRGCYQQCRYY